MKKLIYILAISFIFFGVYLIFPFINLFFNREKKEILSDTNKVVLKIKEDLDYQNGFLKSVNSKLDNKRFAENAPESVIQNEMKKKNDALLKISVLEERLKKLNS